MTLNKKNIRNLVRVIIYILFIILISYITTQLYGCFFKDNKRKKSVHSTKFNMGKRKYASFFIINKLNELFKINKHFIFK